MGTALIPLAIALCGMVAAGLLFAAGWKSLAKRLETVGMPYRREIDIAGLNVRPEALGFLTIAVAVTVWLVELVLFRPDIVGALFEFVVIVGAALFAVGIVLRLLVSRTIRRFNDQLENVLRMLASAVRVGLGLRQALVHVAEQSADPARRELLRVVGLSNLGVALVDAVDELADRMPLQEVRMLASVLRVQARTGSDLGGVLEGLADTIRDRRRFRRKLAAIVSQSRASAWVLGVLPLVMGAYVMATQPSLRDAELHTSIGQATLALALGLDALAVMILTRMTRLDA